MEIDNVGQLFLVKIVLIKIQCKGGIMMVSALVIFGITYLFIMLEKIPRHIVCYSWCTCSYNYRYSYYGRRHEICQLGDYRFTFWHVYYH